MRLLRLLDFVGSRDHGERALVLRRRLEALDALREERQALLRLGLHRHLGRCSRLRSARKSVITFFFRRCASVFCSTRTLASTCDYTPILPRVRETDLTALKNKMRDGLGGCGLARGRDVRAHGLLALLQRELQRRELVREVRRRGALVAPKPRAARCAGY